ncbi:hypothetical protein COU76_05715, partial [Candidatus Peregrinibacteria bacterium CG10_big_fil_rev_8_21_14_0_10_49_10]
MQPQIDQVTALLQKAPPANPGDYTSPEEFAADLLRVLAEQKGFQARDEELANMVTHLVRRRDWYEKAVLCDFHILQSGAEDVNMELLRLWATQALTFSHTGCMPSYNALLAIGYTWLEAYEHVHSEGTGRPRYEIFPSDEIPCPESRPSPPPPPIVAFFLRKEVPDVRGELQAYVRQLERLVERDADIRKTYVRYLAECHEPDMLPYHMNTIGHTYRENTEEQWREMAARHISQHNFFLAEFEAFRA